MIILNREGDEDFRCSNASIKTSESKFSSPSVGNYRSSNSYFTLMVFDKESGKITCSLVSKDRGVVSDSVAVNVASDTVNTLNEEVAKLASKMIVSAGCFNVWKGLFK